MAFIRRLRNQNWLFPPTIADLIEEGHICRLVDDVVESIDFKTLSPHGWGIVHDKKQKFGVDSSFKSVTIGFLWY